MKKFPPELLQKIREKINIIEIVGEHVVLRKSGSNYSGLCPFHSERSPSFSVSENKQLYHCYGCKKGGDLFSFVMEIYGIGFPESISDLAERAQVALPSEFDSGVAGEDPETQKRRAAAREKAVMASKLNRFAAAFYHQQLSQFPDAKGYFRGRGVGETQEREFYVGFAPSAWESLSAHLVAKKAPLPLAVELGLIRPSTKQSKPGGSGYFDLFRNRAMFPILDMRGKVAGFGGRALPAPPGEDVGSDGPKYMNSMESLLFQKSKLAFGLYQAQKHIREKDEIIIVEGYFDVVALHAAGFQNVVATCGTSLTPDHLNQFKRLASRITMLFDGDKAGVSATERAMCVGLEHGLVLYGAAMPEGLDPDEVLFDQDTGQPVPEGQAKMSSILKGAHPLLDARIEVEIKQAQEGPEARTQAIKKIAGWLGSFKDPVGRGVRSQDVQQKLGISSQLLDQAFGSDSKGGQASSSQVSQVRTQKAGPPPSPPARARGAIVRNAPSLQGSVSKNQSKKLSQGEKILLVGMARGGQFDRILADFGPKMPPNVTFSDLFDFLPARTFVAETLLEPGLLEKLRASPSSMMQTEIDPQVRAVLTEAWVNSQAQNPSAIATAVSEGDPEDDFKTTLEKLNARLWARFSQQIKAAMVDAEAKKDAELHAKLQKEFLDVQRRMKEFTRFYDQA